MDSNYLITTVSASLVGSWCAWSAYSKWQAVGLRWYLVVVASVVGAWGIFDWMAQQPRETPFYAYVLLAVAPAAFAGSWHVFARRRNVSAPLVILGGASVASVVALTIPFLAYIFP